MCAKLKITEVKNSERCYFCRQKLTSAATCTNEECNKLLGAIEQLIDALNEAFTPILDAISHAAEIIVGAIEECQNK